MNNRLPYWGAIIGSSLGGFIPSLWNADMFSLSGVLFGAVGGFLGIWIGYKLNQ